MRLKWPRARSEEKQFIETVEFFQTRHELDQVLDKLEAVLDKMDLRLRELSSEPGEDEPPTTEGTGGDPPVG